MKEYGKEGIHHCLAQMVGPEHVAIGDSIAPFPDFHSLPREPRPPDWVVKPRSVKEIQKIVRLANQQGLILVSRSSTSHFSRISVPAQSWLLVDLSRMNTIHSIDERNRAARIEPGVRWGQLQDELKKHSLRANIPLLPPAEKSALTCFLEREPPLIPKFEYAEPILTMEVVLANGNVFRTGSASGPASLKKTQASLVGPYGPSVMDFFRLFQGARGSLGIVTWMNVKVEVLPVLQKLVFIPCRTLNETIQPLYRIQRRMLGYECLALNHRHLASILAKEGPEGFQEQKDGLPPWTVILGLGGGRRHPEQKLEYEEEALREISRELSLELGEGLAGLDSSFLAQLQRPWEGKRYWKHRGKGHALDVFFITTLNRVAGCASAFAELAAQHGVNPEEIGMYLQPLEYGRACHVEFSIPFSPDSREEVAQVRAVAKAGMGLISRQGGFFSRPDGIGAEFISERSPSYRSAISQLKKILDPQGILNPGG